MHQARECLYFVVRACSFLLVVVWPLNPSSAWELDEHFEIAKLAYIRACDRLVEEYDTRLSDSTSENEIVELLMSSQRLNQIACREKDRIAERYARAVAFTDHVESPKALADEFKSQVQAGSLIAYAKIALNNSSHFWPEVQSTWEHYHVEALDLAEDALKHESILKQEQAFELALYYTAFADHHLQDAFASGHSGFARINSSPNSALRKCAVRC